MIAADTIDPDTNVTQSLAPGHAEHNVVTIVTVTWLSYHQTSHIGADGDHVMSGLHHLHGLHKCVLLLVLLAGLLQDCK